MGLLMDEKGSTGLTQLVEDLELEVLEERTEITTQQLVEVLTELGSTYRSQRRTRGDQYTRTG